MAAPATMEEVANRLARALLKVVSSKDIPGPGRQTIEVLCDPWPVVCPRLQADLLELTYRPGEIRRASSRGGRRAARIGDSDVVDRVVCEAVRQVLEPLYEPTFHPSSHGVRPAEVATRRWPKPNSISRTATGGW